MTDGSVFRDAQYSKNKGFAEDLTEGKFSFPVVHAIHANPTSRLVISAFPPPRLPPAHPPAHSPSSPSSSPDSPLTKDTLQKKTTSPALLTHCVSYLNTETHSFEYTRGVLETLAGEVRKEVRRLEGLMGRENEGGNKLLESVLKKLGEAPGMQDGAEEGEWKGTPGPTA